MFRSKAAFAAWFVMALIAVVMAFFWSLARWAFLVLAGCYGVYGFISFGADFCRWLQRPDSRQARGRAKQ